MKTNIIMLILVGVIALCVGGLLLNSIYSFTQTLSYSNSAIDLGYWQARNYNLTRLTMSSSTPADISPAATKTTPSTLKNPATTTPTTTPSVKTLSLVPSSSKIEWGAFVGDANSELAAFEAMVGRKVDIVADFENWQYPFPLNFSSSVGAQGKTLLIYWEPSFGFNSIIDGSKDAYIKKYAADAKTYGYKVLLAPFTEMNLNEGDWGYGVNGNTPANFKEAWIHVRKLFADATNVKFVLDYNNVPEPNIPGNQYTDYYPGSQYVDYIGVNGFNFGTPWQPFAEMFDAPMAKLQAYGKPIYILSMASAPGARKVSWINDFAAKIRTYPNIAGWIWFNENKERDWRVNSDSASLEAFKKALP